MLGPSALRRPFAILAACMVALLAGGCGAGPSKPDVIARGNAICAATLRSARAVVPPTSGNGTALHRYLQRVLPIVEQEVAQLRKLPRPAADRAILDRYVAAVTRAAADYQALATAAARNDLPGLARGLAALRSNPAGSLARQYGLSQCASAAGTSQP